MLNSQPSISHSFKFTALALAFMSVNAAYADTALEQIQVTAEDQVKQSLGVSVITAKDLDKMPVNNDISDVVKTMPGVTLSGNSTSGSRGNKRQIDLRAMGPENTLILIDGKPVTSRHTERYGRDGTRNTRGDSNWVPVDEIESIEVLRGPAAARYGSGAMGGVVNIKTKGVTNDFKGSFHVYTDQPESDQEGATYRTGFNLSGPLIKDVLSFRLFGNIAKVSPDDRDINGDVNARDYSNKVAGREGWRNRDIAGRLSWAISPEQTLTLDASYSRQGNIYNGDTQSSTGGGLTGAYYNIFDQLAAAKAETSRLYRQSYTLTHQGKWSWGENRTYFSFDSTKNSHLPEGILGSMEGLYTSMDGFVDSKAKNYRFSNELYIPLNFIVDQMLTIGLEANHSKQNDNAAMTQTMSSSYGVIPWLSETGRTGVASIKEYAMFVEDNMIFNKNTVLIPGLRFDYHSQSGSNWSPSLNFSHQLNEHWKLKGGVARAYKAPNFYQSQPNYLLINAIRGCPIDKYNNVHNNPFATTVAARDTMKNGDGWGNACYFVGNPDVKPETSWNKEIGFEYNNNGYLFSLAYFHNDYRNKIISNGSYIGQISSMRTSGAKRGTYNDNSDEVNDVLGGRDKRTYYYTNLYQWGNTPRAVIAGFEGNLTLPLIQDKLVWTTNFTYFHRSEDKQTGNPLSIVPKYTINTNINYQVTDNLDMNLSYTRYGKQMTPANPVYFMQVHDSTGASKVTQYELGSYGIFGLNVGYKWNNGVSLRVGVSNVLDKEIQRVRGTANSYNERRRSYYADLKYSF